jgi:hypothetical protein
MGRFGSAATKMVVPGTRRNVAITYITAWTACVIPLCI